MVTMKKIPVIVDCSLVHTHVGSRDCAAQPIATMQIGDAVADACRLEIITLLMQVAYLPATTLARSIGMSPQATRFHLRKLEAAGIVRAENCGRHRYYRIAKPEVAEIVEELCRLTQLPAKIVGEARRDHMFIEARYCYDHLAGRWAVRLTQFLLEHNVIVGGQPDYQVTQYGERFFRDFGIDIHMLRSSPRRFARRCIDWTERREHLGGMLGAALAQRFVARGWIKRAPGRRAVIITHRGRDQLARLLCDDDQPHAREAVSGGADEGT